MEPFAGLARMLPIWCRCTTEKPVRRALVGRGPRANHLSSLRKKCSGKSEPESIRFKLHPGPRKTVWPQRWRTGKDELVSDWRVNTSPLAIRLSIHGQPILTPTAWSRRPTPYLAKDYVHGDVNARHGRVVSCRVSVGRSIDFTENVFNEILFWPLKAPRSPSNSGKLAKAGSSAKA